MKSITYCLTAILVILIAGCSKSQYPAKQKSQQKSRKILQAVQKRYHSHSSLEVHARRKLHLQIDVRARNMHKSNVRLSSIYFACKLPGKMRYESDNKTKQKENDKIIIADGHSVWYYSPQKNEYGVQKKDLFTQTSVDQLEKGFRSLVLYNHGKNFIRAFNPVADDIRKITNLGQVTLTMPDKSQRKALKIKVEYAQNKSALNKLLKKLTKGSSSAVKNITHTPVTFWVAPKTSTVLRVSFGGSTRVKPGQAPITMVLRLNQDIYYTSVDLHPTFTNKTFSFQPPKGAKKIENLKKLK